MTTIIDLVVDDNQNNADPELALTPPGVPPLHVVHIRLAEEYALLQRAYNGPPKTGTVDILA